MTLKHYNPKIVYEHSWPHLEYQNTVHYDLSDFEEALLKDLAIRLDELDLDEDPELRLQHLMAIYTDIALELEYNKQMSESLTKTNEIPG